jgi:hypothetical protein
MEQRDFLFPQGGSGFDCGPPQRSMILAISMPMGIWTWWP